MNSILLAAAVPFYILPSCIAFSAQALGIPPTIIVPEVHHTRLTQVSQLVSSALGDNIANDNDDSSDTTAVNRYASARDAVSDFQVHDNSSKGGDTAVIVPSHELVYGELSVPVLATILDAVGVQEDDVFLDIGSGDGALVLGASLLYAYASFDDGDGSHEGDGGDTNTNTMSMLGSRNAIQKCYGADIVPGLVDRSMTHSKNLERIMQEGQSSNGMKNIDLLEQNQSEIQFLLGDIHQPDDELQNVLKETTLAVCFATTWSAGNAHNDDTTPGQSSTSLQGRKLPKLSKALSAGLSSGCRVVIIDGKLDADDDFSWEGDLRIQCPDTAPYSVAALYHKQ
mmetsp:Transcript_20561/g.44636  ORF Transcript_20561/g.44636 Transcript_20561/m.44636 type:complete len:340 (+) Transcript_20561:66-1085(+)